MLDMAVRTGLTESVTPEQRFGSAEVSHLDSQGSTFQAEAPAGARIL
jgi:hypothetical protein